MRIGICDCSSEFKNEITSGNSTECPGTSIQNNMIKKWCKLRHLFMEADMLLSMT